MTPEQELQELVAGLEPQQAMLVLLQWLFVKMAEMEGSLAVLTPTIGAIAGRVGLTKEDLLRFIGEYRDSSL